MTSAFTPVPPTLDQALLKRCVAGEANAWRSFHRHYYPIAAAFLRKLGTRPEELEDACQEVFLQAHRYLPSFRGEAEIKTWLYRLCVTEARRLRRRGRLGRMLRAWLTHEPADVNVTPPATRTDDAILALVEKALGAMNEGERLVFVLFEMEGLAGKDVAAIAGCPEATLWRRLHHARKIFRTTLGDEDASAPAINRGVQGGRI